MSEKTPIDELTITVKEVSQLQKALFAYIGGSLDSWAIILEENPEMKNTVIKDMKEMAANFRKKAGVTIVSL